MGILDTFDLSGRCAFITGASSGLGWRFATALGELGASCVVAARRTDRLGELKDAIKSAGGKAHSVALDVTDDDSIEAALNEAREVFGPVSILVNNAGVATDTWALETSREEWRRVLDTNLNGVWATAQFTARQMVEAKQGGSIINIASILGFGVSKATSPYAISKAAVVHMTKALALEWGRHDIRVNAIAPGYVMTDISRYYLESEAGQKLIKRLPLRRVGEPEDLDGVLALLASDASAFMTGSTVVIDGGQLLDIS